MIVRTVYGRYTPKPPYDIIYEWLCQWGWRGHRTDRKIGPLSKYVNTQTMMGEQACYDFLSYLKSHGYVHISVLNNGLVQIMVVENPLNENNPDQEYYRYFDLMENLMRK